MLKGSHQLNLQPVVWIKQPICCQFISFLSLTSEMETSLVLKQTRINQVIQKQKVGWAETSSLHLPSRSGTLRRFPLPAVPLFRYFQLHFLWRAGWKKWLLPPAFVVRRDSLLLFLLFFTSAPLLPYFSPLKLLPTCWSSQIFQDLETSGSAASIAAYSGWTWKFLKQNTSD